MVLQTVAGIESLAAEVERIAKTVQTLADGGANIGAVLGVIQGVAEQTNLLALNAAIEAARAGEQGRGFAVVADEVRSLASRTQKSTLEIEEIVRTLHDSGTMAVSAIEGGRRHVEEMVTQAGNAGDALQRIRESVAHITDMNAHIASAAEQQSAVAEDINRNITDITAAVSQTAGTAEETAKSAEALSELSGRLASRIEQFRIHQSGN